MLITALVTSLISHSANFCTSIFLNFIFVLAVLGLRCCSDFSLVAASRGDSLVVLHKLLTVVASLLVEQGL